MIKGLCSVIIPFYNGANYIEDTVNSILASDYEQLEIIIVDDGSPEQEKSNAILTNLASLDQKIQIYHKPNGGIADARNFGLSEANGEYIAFCDQDDLVAANQYSSLINMMRSTDSDLAVSEFFCYDGKSKIANSIISGTCTMEVKEIRELQKWLLIGETYSYDGIKIPSAIWNCLFKSKIIKENSIVMKSYLQYDDDYNLLLQYLSACNRIHITQQAFYTWFIRASSESHTRKIITNISERYDAFLKFKESFKNFLAITDNEWECFVNYYYANQICVFIRNEAAKCKSVRSFFRGYRTVTKYLAIKRPFRYNSHVAKQIRRITGKRSMATYWCSSHFLVSLAMAINI